MPDRVAHRSAVDVLRLDVNDLHIVHGEETPERGDREVEGMLVIDLVVRRFADDVAKVGILEHERARGLEQRAHARDDRVQIRDVTHHVCRRDHVGLPVLPEDLLREIGVEEARKRPDPFGPRDIGHVG